MRIKYQNATDEELKALAADRDKPEVKERFLRSAVKIVERRVSRYVKLYPIDREDLMQFCYIAVMKAMYSWDTEHSWHQHVSVVCNQMIIFEGGRDFCRHNCLPKAAIKKAALRGERAKGTPPLSLNAPANGDFDDSAELQDSIESGEDSALRALIVNDSRDLENLLSQSKVLAKDKTGQLKTMLSLIQSDEVYGPSAVARQYGVTAQAVSQKWLKFQKEMKEIIKRKAA